MAMKMTAPRLRHRVDIQVFTLMQDENTGAMTELWGPLHTSLPAEIMPLSGREFVAAQAVQAGVTTRITIRYVDGIKPAMRVVHGLDIYNIQAVLPDPTLRRHLTLMCEVGPQLDPPEQVIINEEWSIFASSLDQAVNGGLPS